MIRLVLALVLLVAAPLAASAQPLAEVARLEAERRKAVAAHGKVYTNDDLRPDTLTPAPPAVPVDPAAPAAAEDAEAPAAQDPPQDQAYWSGRIAAARADLQRSQMFAQALQSRLNGLNADFVNRDDPIQRAQIADDRDKALAELDRVNTEIANQTRAIADIQDEARRAGVPPGWLRDPS